MWYNIINNLDTGVIRMYDCAIIGTGPAGLSAALNLKIHNKSVIWVGSSTLSDKVSKAEQISNYPGFINASGKELSEAFGRQVKEMGLEITDGMVSSVYPMDDHYAIAVGSEFYEAKTVILATGIVSKATLKGEGGLLGLGVSYCATCDGMLYRGKTIAVICSNPRFEHEVRFLSELAGKVYLYTSYKNVGEMGENVEILTARPTGINGDDHVTGISLSDGTEIAVDGVFILRESIAPTTLLPGIELDGGHIAVNRSMETNMKGCYAAGDCTGRPYQYTKAVGEGNVAAHSVIDYLGK
jgi:thioredoxin reductase (NADPH)